MRSALGSDTLSSQMTEGDTVTTQETPTAPLDDAPSPPPAKISRGRLIGVDVLIGLTTVLAVVGMLAIWANRLLLNPDNWSNTSTQLLQNADIRDATSNYIVDQLYANVNVAQLLRSGLPPQLQPLAGPAAGALRNAAVKGVDLALQRPLIQNLWTRANRRADQAFVAIVNGGKGPVGIQSGTVTLDLASIIDNAASRLGLPAGLGAKLPPNIGQLTIIKSNQLKAVQDIGSAVKGLALWLTILIPILYLLAVVLARYHRRRTLMTVGFAILIAGVIGIAGRHILDSAITNSLVKDESLRPAVSATVLIGTGLLAEIANAFILVGAAVIVAAWFAGPAGIAVAGRRAIAPFMRDQPVATYGIVVAVMILIFIWQPIHATGTPAGIIAFLALALVGTALLRRQVMAEFPNVQAGEVSAWARGRVESFRDTRERRKRSGHGNDALTDQLERLVKLRDEGKISQEDYDAVKGRLLGG
jgi:hypothetical protein